MIPGEVRVSTEPLEFGTDAEKITMVVVNDGDRPIQIGSHLHLPAANPALTFDREAADGFRLDIPLGNVGSVRTRGGQQNGDTDRARRTQKGSGPADRAGRRPTDTCARAQDRHALRHARRRGRRTFASVLGERACE